MKVKIPPKVTANAFNKIMSIGGKKCLRVAVEGGGREEDAHRVREREEHQQQQHQEGAYISKHLPPLETRKKSNK